MNARRARYENYRPQLDDEAAQEAVRLLAHDYYQLGLQYAEAQWGGQIPPDKMTKYKNKCMVDAQHHLYQLSLAARSEGDIVQAGQSGQIMVDGGLGGKDQPEQMAKARWPKERKDLQQESLVQSLLTIWEARREATAEQVRIG